MSGGTIWSSWRPGMASARRPPSSHPIAIGRGLTARPSVLHGPDRAIMWAHVDRPSRLVVEHQRLHLADARRAAHHCDA